MLSLVVFQLVKDIKKARHKFHRVSNKLLLKTVKGSPYLESPTGTNALSCDN